MMRQMGVLGWVLMSLSLTIGCGKENVRDNNNEGVYKSCTVETGNDGVVIRCPDGSEATVETPEKAGGCELTDHNDGTYTVACDGSDPITLRDGQAGDACEIERSEGVVTMTCGEDSVRFDVPHCGNGIIEAGEVCDEGDANGSCEFSEDGETVCNYCLTSCTGYEQQWRHIVDGTVVSITQGELGVVEGAQVTIGEHELISDGLGKFQLIDLEPGNYTVSVEDAWTLQGIIMSRPRRLAPQYTTIRMPEVGQTTPVVLRTLIGYSKVFAYEGAPVDVDFSSITSTELWDVSPGAWQRLKLELGPNSLVDANGVPFTGQVELTIYPVFMPTDSQEKWLHYMQGIPHPFNEQGDRLRMWAASAVELRSVETGEKLALAEDGEAAALISADMSVELPMSTWYFDTKKMAWIESNKANELADTSYGSENVGLDDVGFGAIRVELDTLGWVAVGQLDERAWTCVRGQTAPGATPGAADIGAQFAGAAAQTSSSNDGTFCLDVPQTNKVVLHGQAYRSSHERFHNARVENLSNQGAASCGTTPDDCLDLGVWELEDINGYCIDATGVRVSLNSSSNPSNREPLEGIFVNYPYLEHVDLDFAQQVEQAEHGFMLESYFRWGSIEFPNNASCIPVNWRRPRLHMRDEKLQFCNSHSASHLLMSPFMFDMDPLHGPQDRTCSPDSDNNDACYPLALNDHYFFCGS